MPNRTQEEWFEHMNRVVDNIQHRDLDKRSKWMLSPSDIQAFAEAVRTEAAREAFNAILNQLKDPEFSDAYAHINVGLELVENGNIPGNISGR